MSQNGARNMADQGADHVGILSFYYPNTVVSPTAPLDNIRVHIGDATRIEMTSAGPLTFERNGTVLTSSATGAVQVTAHDGGLQIGDRWTTGAANDPVFVSFPQPVTISNNGHSYLWGKIQLTNHDGKVRVVEVLGLEEYVAGIAEMPAAWPIEALMAQAIAARTYAHEVTLHRRASLEWAQEYDISGTTVDQNYIGWDAQDSAWDQRWTAAVSATAGVEIVDNNGPIRAYYSASNGGWTETAAYVFNNDVPYTVAGPDPFDAGGHNWTEWTRTYSQSGMSRWLNNHADTSVGTLTAINVLGGQGASARLDKATVELVGTADTKRVTGRRLMVVMNAGIFGEGLGLDDHLPGTFTTIGNGASVGFPQPSGTQVAAQVTPDSLTGVAPVDDSISPPAGFSPEPGTGVAPLVLADSAASDGDAGFAPVAEIPATVPSGFLPDPASGVAPIPIDDVDADQANPSGAAPDPASGVAPIPVDDAASTASTDAASTAITDEDSGAAANTAAAPDPDSGVPPVADSPSVAEDFTPDPASGVPPVAATTTETSAGGIAPDPASGVAPVPVDDTTTVGGTGGGVTSEFPTTADEAAEIQAALAELAELDLDYCGDDPTSQACVILQAIVSSKDG